MTREEKDKLLDIYNRLGGIATSLEQEPCDTCEHADEIDGNNCYECVKGMRNNYNLKKQEPCDNTIARILKRMWNCRGKHTTSIDKVKMEQIIRDELPSVKPQEPKR